MEGKKQLCGYYNYTVVLTYLGMLAGFTGITFAMEGSYRKAILCLMAAGICDMFDGAVAATRQRDEREKKFGIQIDSLSDLICFGVLSALFTYQVGGKGHFVFLAGSFYVLCTLIRLAYFNVLEEERQQIETGSRTSYLGLPVTSAALILPVLFIIGRRLALQEGLLFGAALSLMAVAFLLPVKIKKPYLAGKIGIVFTGTVEFVILIMGLGMDL